MKHAFAAMIVATVVAGCGSGISAQESAQLTEEFVVACATIRPHLGGADDSNAVDLCRCVHRKALAEYDARELQSGILGGKGPKPADLENEITACAAEHPRGSTG